MSAAPAAPLAADRRPTRQAAAATVPRCGRRARGRVTVRLGPVSTRLDVRVVGLSLALALVVAIGLAWSVSVGDFPIPMGEVVGELTGLHRSEDSTFVIRTLRLPRALTGVLVGAAFGLSGQIFQRLVRNPLASPDILGVSAGGAVGAVSCIVLVGVLTTAAITGAALVGAMLAVAAIYVLAIKGGLSSYRLVLIGIGITAMLTATVDYLLTRAELYDAQRATLWLTGSLNGRGWEFVWPLSVVLALLVPLSLVLGRSLRALELGDDAAAGLGLGLRRSKLALSLVGAALAAVATAAAGPIAFVALVAPQIARRLVGDRTLALVPAALVGAAIVVFADLAARRLFAPTELPVGVATAVVGAPYLLWLLARANRIGAGG